MEERLAKVLKDQTEVIAREKVKYSIAIAQQKKKFDDEVQQLKATTKNVEAQCDRKVQSERATRASAVALSCEKRLQEQQ